MILHTVIRDCLYLNWSVPVGALPELPEPLRGERHGEGEAEEAFVSAVLFRQEELHHELAPFLQLAYPQCNLRLYVRDADGVASVFFLRMLVPPWVVAGARLLGHQPATPAALDFPPPGLGGDLAFWRWSVAGGERLTVEAQPGAGVPGPGPDLGSWQKAVAHFRERPRGYGVQGGRLRRVEAFHPTVEHAPVRVSVGETGLLSEALPAVDPERWRRPHSAFLCPRVPFAFDLGTAPSEALPVHLPAPSG